MMVWNQQPNGERRLKLERHRGASREARRFVERLLRERQLPEQTVENAMLVSSELVSNAYCHGTGEIELRVSLIDGYLRVEVIDEGRGKAPGVRDQGPGEPGGWGLRIVDQVAVQWGVFEGTTHVWADLAVD
jgi:anti-sigma regulatory factor (Ser/Thr protein kinase)